MYPSVSPWNQWLCLCYHSSISSVKKTWKGEKESLIQKSSKISQSWKRPMSSYEKKKKKDGFILPLQWGWHMAQSRLLGSLLPSLHHDPMWVNQVWWKLVFPCCQEKLRYTWGHWGGTETRQRVTMVWWPAAIKSKFVIPGTISVPGLNHFELCFYHCELNSPCLMQATLIHSELSVAWMLRRKL